MTSVDFNLGPVGGCFRDSVVSKSFEEKGMINSIVYGRESSKRAARNSPQDLIMSSLALEHTR